MHNEGSCRFCGLELTSLVMCKFCDETNSWICKRCGITVQRLHSHDKVQLSAITNQNISRLFE